MASACGSIGSIGGGKDQVAKGPISPQPIPTASPIAAGTPAAGTAPLTISEQSALQRLTVLVRLQQMLYVERSRFADRLPDLTTELGLADQGATAGHRFDLVRSGRPDLTILQAVAQEPRDRSLVGLAWAVGDRATATTRTLFCLSDRPGPKPPTPPTIEPGSGQGRCQPGSMVIAPNR